MPGWEVTAHLDGHLDPRIRPVQMYDGWILLSEGSYDTMSVCILGMGYGNPTHISGNVHVTLRHTEDHEVLYFQLYLNSMHFSPPCPVFDVNVNICNIVIFFL